MIWTEDKLEQLRRLWDEGKTAGQIALVMDTSRGSVLGKVHRLNLSARPNPVTTDAEKFERLIDFIAEQPDSHITIREAARRVSLKIAVADRLWRDFIYDFAWHPQVGAEIYP